MKKFIVNLICCFILSPGLRGAVRNRMLNNYKTAYRLLRSERRGQLSLTDDLAIIAMIRNEGAYLAEWIEYHKLVGVSRFYIFDNESTDDTKKVLAPYIKSGIVIYQYLPDDEIERLKPNYNVDTKSHVAHWLALEQCRTNTKWIAIIDVDEFLLPKQNNTILEFLSQFPKNINQIIVGWDVYGSNGHKVKPQGLTIENYTRKGKIKDNRAFKTIVNPRSIVVDFNHYHTIIGKTADETGRILQRYVHKHKAPTNVCACNHYITRSYEECSGKCVKNKNIQDRRYKSDYFKLYDKNDELDESMLKYAGKVKQAIMDSKSF